MNIRRYIPKVVSSTINVHSFIDPYYATISLVPLLMIAVYLSFLRLLGPLRNPVKDLLRHPIRDLFRNPDSNPLTNPFRDPTRDML